MATPYEPTYSFGKLNLNLVSERPVMLASAALAARPRTKEPNRHNTPNGAVSVPYDQ